MSTSSGGGKALDAAVTDAGSGTGSDPVGDAQRNLDACQAKLKKQERHLAGARKAVTEAKAAVEAAKKSEG